VFIEEDPKCWKGATTARPEDLMSLQQRSLLLYTMLIDSCSGIATEVVPSPALMGSPKCSAYIDVPHAPELISYDRINVQQADDFDKNIDPILLRVNNKMACTLDLKEVVQVTLERCSNISLDTL
jgi:hypothetical protein